SNRWGKDWIKWKQFGKFVSQMVKWAQRRESQKRYISVINSNGKKGNFIVDVTNAQNRFVNFLALNANVLLPSGRDQTVAMAQTAPGRYAVGFPAEEIGAYYFSVYSNSGDLAGAPQTFGFGIPYTAEFKRTAVNRDLLDDLASTTKGKVLSIDKIPADFFKSNLDKRKSKTPVWPYLIMIFLLLLIADVVARKLIFTGSS
ncbi:MAG: hypothetical protein PVH42_23625, partial [Desulfobacterales bacterium]